MLGRDDEEGRPEQRVGTGGEHGDVDVELVDSKEDLRPFRPADPVSLHRQHSLRPFHVLHLVEQMVRVRGDPEEPLVELARFDLGAAALAAPVSDLLVRQDGLVVRTPVHERGFPVHLPGLEELQEEPLRPAVVLGLVGRELPRPVDRPAESLHRPADRHDVPLDDHPGMLARLDRRVLRRQPEGVVAHRAQHLMAGAAVEMREDVAQRVDQDVADVQRAGRVRQHLEHEGLALVARSPGLGVRHLEGSVLLPGPLPFHLDCLRVVLVHDRPLETKKPLAREAVGSWRGLRHDGFLPYRSSSFIPPGS